MVGNGPLGRWLEAFAAAHPTVHVLPYQTERDRLAALFASADLYVSAAPHETFGLSVLEAQAAGLPVVGVRAGAMIDRVPPALGRLAEPGSAASLAEAIVGLWREGARPFGRRARRLVETSFSWRQTFERLFPLYQDVLAHAAFR
jgi:alpha-1,6-mannosyltransferase